MTVYRNCNGCRHDDGTCEIKEQVRSSVTGLTPRLTSVLFVCEKRLEGLEPGSEVIVTLAELETHYSTVPHPMDPEEYVRETGRMIEVLGVVMVDKGPGKKLIIGVIDDRGEDLQVENKVIKVQSSRCRPTGKKHEICEYCQRPESIHLEGACFSPDGRFSRESYEIFDGDTEVAF